MSAHPDAMGGWSERDNSKRCPMCEHPITDDNQRRSLPEYLEGIKGENVPSAYRGTAWHLDGCTACMDEIVLDFSKHWLSQGVNSMEDVAGLIADHLELNLPRKVTA